jgi:hypothetical protein
MVTKTEKKVLALSAELWETYITMPKQHPDEHNELRDAIHHIQGLVAMRIARATHPDLYIDHSVKKDKKPQSEKSLLKTSNFS